jgi:integrase
LAQKLDVHVFRLRNGKQSKGLHRSFEQFLKDLGILKDKFGDNRTLYSLRHTYATLELLENKTDIHTLAKQMGNSAAMIEKHYSKLTPTMAAEQLA